MLIFPYLFHFNFPRHNTIFHRFIFRASPFYRLKFKVERFPRQFERVRRDEQLRTILRVQIVSIVRK